MIKVLLIEDSDDFADLLINAIGLYCEEIKVTHSISLDYGMQSFSACQFDLILLDLGLSDSQGIAAFATMNLIATDIPIIIISGSVSQELLNESIALGAFDYIMKPFTIESLIDKIMFAVSKKKLRVDKQQLVSARAKLHNSLANITRSLITCRSMEISVGQSK